MKKVIFVILFAFTSASVSTLQSCSAGYALTNGNVRTIASSLLSVLTSKLGLSPTQSPVVSSLLKTFLNNKVNILGLAKSNPTIYASQLGGLTASLMSGLRGILNSNQITALATLKPTTNDPKNVLSNLFF